MRLAYAVMGMCAWFIMILLWEMVNGHDMTYPLDGRVFVLTVLNGGLVGFLSGSVIKLSRELKEASTTKKFVDLLFSPAGKAEEMLMAQAVLCERASQGVIQFQNGGFRKYSEVASLYEEDQRLKNIFRSEQELFYLMYDEMMRRSVGCPVPFRKRSFKEWLPSTTTEG